MMSQTQENTGSVPLVPGHPSQSTPLLQSGASAPGSFCKDLALQRDRDDGTEMSGTSSNITAQAVTLEPYIPYFKKRSNRKIRFKPILMVNRQTEKPWDKFFILGLRGNNEEICSINKISPLKVRKCIVESIGYPESITKSREGLVHVTVVDSIQSENILKIRKIDNQDVIVLPNKVRNNALGVIKCKDLAMCSDEELCEELKDQGVINVRRITRKSQGTEIIPTDLIVLTFNTSKTPEAIDTGYYPVKVRPYIQRPMQCRKCYVIGHKEKWCKINICRCGYFPHVNRECPTPMCANCGGPHMSDNRNCPSYLQEVQIQKVMAKHHIKYSEAKNLVTSPAYLQENVSYAERVRETKQNMTEEDTNQNLQIKRNYNNKSEENPWEQELLKLKQQMDQYSTQHRKEQQELNQKLLDLQLYYEHKIHELKIQHQQEISLLTKGNQIHKQMTVPQEEIPQQQITAQQSIPQKQIPLKIPTKQTLYKIEVQKRQQQQRQKQQQRQQPTQLYQQKKQQIKIQQEMPTNKKLQQKHELINVEQIKRQHSLTLDEGFTKSKTQKTNETPEAPPKQSHPQSTETTIDDKIISSTISTVEAEGNEMLTDEQEPWSKEKLVSWTNEPKGEEASNSDADTNNESDEPKKKNKGWKKGRPRRKPNETEEQYQERLQKSEQGERKTEILN